MRVYPYNSLMREFVNVADAMNRAVERSAYDYARHGGSTDGSPNDTENGDAVKATPRVPVMRLPVDAWANDEAYTVSAYLPGVNPDEVEITFEGEELTVRGAFQPRVEGVEFARRELYHGAFERRIGFNVPVNAEAIEATFANGVLTLRVPKAEVVKPKQIKVVAK